MARVAQEHARCQESRENPPKVLALLLLDGIVCQIILRYQPAAVEEEKWDEKGDPRPRHSCTKKHVFPRTWFISSWIF